MEFVPALQPENNEPTEALWFAFQNDKLMVSLKHNKAELPKLFDLDELTIKPVRTQYLGALNGVKCFSAELSLTMPCPENRSFHGFFELFGMLDEDMYKIAVYAHQIIAWDRDHQYCGKCGESTELKTDERARICPACKHICFPRITPAIMVAILKGNEILLAANKTFPPEFYSVLAGFVEPGERLEECIAREVKEEVGLEIKNINYFNSQPWPFPNSLMIAFTADYAGGEIQVDGVEITKAGWYSKENLPRCPEGNLSVAGKLIDWFRRSNGSND